MPDSSEAGVRLQLLFDEPPALLADFLGSPRPRHPGDDGVDGFLLAKARILLKVDLDNLSCDLMVLSGTLAHQSSTAAFLAPSLTFFTDLVRTLTILQLAWKMRRILFYGNRFQTKYFRLRMVNFLPKNPTRMLYQ